MTYTTGDLLLAAARHHPDRPAVQDGDTVTTYQQLADQAHACARHLARNTGSGERVAILLPRSASTLAVYFGAHLAALVPVVVHEQLRPRQVAQIIEHSGAALAVTDHRTAALLRDCALTPQQVLDAGSLQGPALSVRPRTIGRDLAQLAYTSGSTGAAKGVMLSHDNLLAGARIVADYLHLTGADRVMALLPWSFDYGLNQILSAFAAAATVVIQRSPLPGDIARTLSSGAVTGLAGVPTVWSALAAAGSPFLQERLPHLRYLTNSGGALPPTAIQTIRAAHPQLQVFAMYGLTEAFRSTYLPPDRLADKPTSIGRPVPDSDLLVLDEHDRPCPTGVEGQFVHRGPTVALGYWRDPDATAAVFRPRPGAPGGTGETVVYSGDFGYADPDGDLHYRGRRDDLFKSRGQRVTCPQIEQELAASGLVALAAVVTAPAPGQADPLILAAVQPGPGFTRAALDAYCRNELPAHMRPHRITVLSQIPCTPHGKIDSAALRQQLTANPPARAGSR